MSFCIFGDLWLYTVKLARWRGAGAVAMLCVQMLGDRTWRDGDLCVFNGEATAARPAPARWLLARGGVACATSPGRGAASGAVASAARQRRRSLAADIRAAS